MSRGRRPWWLTLYWRLEYALMRGAAALLQSTPYEAGEALARAVGRLYYRISGARRRTAIENLRIAFGAEKDEAERVRIAKASFEHGFLMLYEVLVRRRLVPHLAAFRRRTRIFGDEAEARQELVRRRGGFLLTGHLGSWETAAAYLAYENAPFAAIARSVPNPFVQAYLTGTRSESLQVFQKRGAVAGSIEAIERGVWVAVLGDQNAGRHGVFVPFFGLPASTYPLVATLVARYGFPVYFGAALRRGPRFRYDFHIDLYRPPPGLDYDQARDHLLYAYHAWLEEKVRRDPEQYLWMHRRWKTRPLDEPPGPHLPQYDHRGPRRGRHHGKRKPLPPIPIP